MGGKGGSGKSPYQDEIGALIAGTLMSQAATRDPYGAKMFGPGTKLGGAFNQLFPGMPVPTYKPPPQAQSFGDIYKQTAGNLGMPTPAIGQSAAAGTGGQVLAMRAPTEAPARSTPAFMKGAGALSPVPTGNISTPTATPKTGMSTQMPTPTNTGIVPPTQPQPTQVTPTSPVPTQVGGPPSATIKPYNYNVASPPTLSPVQMPDQRYALLSQMGTEQMAQNARLAQDDLLRAMEARGLGRSGVAAQEVVNQYNRGLAQNTANFARGLAAERMGQEFGEAQQFRNLLAQYYPALRGQDIQANLGLGQLGLQEKGQNLAQIQSDQQYQNFLTPIFGALGQSIIGASANKQGKGK